MFQELKFQLSTAILTILTLAAGIAAFINLEQQYKFRLPEDGVVWVERGGHVEALYVQSGGPGANAGIHTGDHVLQIESVPINKAIDVAKVLVAVGVWNKAKYHFVSRGAELDTTLYVRAQELDRGVIYQ